MMFEELIMMKVELNFEYTEVANNKRLKINIEGPPKETGEMVKTIRNSILMRDPDWVEQ